MDKELLTIEFRYTDKEGEYHSKTITIGIYDTLEVAIEEGNKVLDVLSKTFEVRSDDKFMKNHLFGTPKRLVTNCSYPTKGIQYFAKITKLNHENVSDAIKDIFTKIN